MSFNPAQQIPDLSGKTILVTGGNIGLGKESIYQLALHGKNPHIFLAARSKQKADAAIAELQAAVPGANITFLELDLASFDSIKQAAKTFSAQSDRLDVLLNNAGIMACPPGRTHEGYELQFGTNHVGHALLTKLLLPTLKQTAAASSPNAADVRVVNLSSGAHTWAPRAGYAFAELKSDMAGTSTWARYGQSKLANIHFNRELAARHPDLTCVAVHPGSVRTNLTSGPKASYPLFAGVIGFMTRFVTVSVQTGALNQLWAAVGTGVKTGVYYHPVAVEGKESALARDEKLAKELWEWTEKELEGHGG